MYSVCVVAVALLVRKLKFGSGLDATRHTCYFAAINRKLVIFRFQAWLKAATGRGCTIYRRILERPAQK
jgi:hypothetical protein